jgi:acyl carrier protein
MLLEKIEGRILELLAEKVGEPVADIRAKLVARGLDWAADSLTLVEVLLQLEEEWQFDAPQDIETQQNLQSVKALARHIKSLLDEKALRGRLSA